MICAPIFTNQTGSKIDGTEHGIIKKRGKKPIANNKKKICMKAEAQTGETLDGEYPLSKLILLPFLSSQNATSSQILIRKNNSEIR